MTRYLSAIFLFIFSSSLFALTSDSEQPIEISADKVQIDNAKGESIYSGNVELLQGSLRMTGSKLVVKTSPSGDLTKADIYGSPATLTKQPENKELIDAKAEHIEINYDNNQEVTLNKNALLIQGSNKFYGDTIKYLVATDQVIADSQKDSRVKVVISPKSQSAPKPKPSSKPAPQEKSKSAEQPQEAETKNITKPEKESE